MEILHDKEQPSRSNLDQYSPEQISKVRNYPPTPSTPNQDKPDGSDKKNQRADVVEKVEVREHEEQRHQDQQALANSVTAKPFSA